MPQTVTAECAIRFNPIGYWLMACYAYEELDVELMTDADFDALAQWLDTNWHAVKDNHNAYLIDPDFLKSALGVNVPREEWPTRVFFAAHHLLDSIYGEGKWGKPGPSFYAMWAKRFPALPKAKPAMNLDDLC